MIAYDAKGWLKVSFAYRGTVLPRVAVAAIAFGLLGIEEAGVEIEDPFGDDPNDLPVEAMCATIARDTGALAEFGKR